jgi:hypothetical protein
VAVGAAAGGVAGVTTAQSHQGQPTTDNAPALEASNANAADAASILGDLVTMISDKLSAAAEQADSPNQDALAGAEEAAANGLFTASEAVTNAGAPADVPATNPPAERFGQPGWYQSYFFPTAEGPYKFHIFGEIEGTAIDESFTSSEEGFSEVEAATSGQFPVQFPPTDELVSDAQRGAQSADLMPLALGLGGSGCCQDS